MSKVYPLGLVGESNYQAAIRRCNIGERVYIAEEVNNPYDSGALAVERDGGAVIGYIPRDSWLREVIEQGQSTQLTIKSIAGESSDFLGVVVDVVVGHGSSPRLREYKPKKSTDAAAPKARSGRPTTRSTVTPIVSKLLKSVFRW